MENNKTLLIVVFVLAAVTAIAIGVAATLWFTRDSRQAGETRTLGGPVALRGAPGTETTSPAQSAPQSTGVFINEKPVSQEQVNQLAQMYGAAPPPGHYWYDSRSGLYGLWGYEAAGYIRPGHDFGPVPATASRGNTGVFINGRQLNMAEALYCQRIFGAVYQGRWWLDGQTGNLGLEGNPMPMANLAVALQQSRQRGGGDGGYRYRDSLSGTSAGSEGNCTWINVPGSGSAMSSGC